MSSSPRLCGNRRWTSALAAVIAIGGCATIHDGPFATPVDGGGRVLPRPSGPLLVSGTEMADLGSPQFGALEFTFENPTSNWVHVTNVALDFGDQPTNARVSY